MGQSIRGFLTKPERRNSREENCIEMFVHHEEDCSCNMRVGQRVRVPEGALPVETLPMPLYIPRHPPFARKPPGAWRRVLTVSIGNKETSTATPANAPALAAIGSTSMAAE